MNITMLKSKIHRAVVTQAELNYVGSITVDSELLKAAGILASTVLLPVRSRSEITSFSCATHQ